jgi:hypothetical protein
MYEQVDIFGMELTELVKSSSAGKIDFIPSTVHLALCAYDPALYGTNSGKVLVILTIDTSNSRLFKSPKNTRRNLMNINLSFFLA